MFRLSKNTDYKIVVNTKKELTTIIKERLKRNCDILDVNDIDVSHLDDLSEVFHQYDATKCDEIHCENWDVRNVKDMSFMFAECECIETVDLSKWKTDSLRKTVGMFYGCVELHDLNLNNFNVEKVISMREMFRACWKLDVLRIDSWKPKGVLASTNGFNNMFWAANKDMKLFMFDKSYYDDIVYDDELLETSYTTKIKPQNY